MDKKQMVSIVIPAHNEAGVIAHCLEQLVQPYEGLGVEVIVVCNGCSDNTAEIARGFDQVKCIETDIAYKTHALNIGDKAASYFPRFYLDADIRLSFDNISKIILAMEKQHALAAIPRGQMDFTGSSWAVKSYYDIWMNLPYNRKGMMGAGVYVISEEGRKRFSKFPKIHSDGLFIRGIFKGSELIGVRDAFSIVNAPTRLIGLVKIMTRSRMGVQEYKENFPQSVEKHECPDYGGAIKELLYQVHLWPKAGIYLSINLISRMRAHQQKKAVGFTQWERDDSSREKIK